MIKDDVSELLSERSRLLGGLVTEIAGRVGCSAEDINYLQLSEIEQALQESSMSTELIAERRELTILFYPKTNLEIYEGERAQEFLQHGEFVEVAAVSNQKILHGQTASLGTASGTAVVVSTSVEANRLMTRGAILVAPYTAVEYLPAMRQAAAIITETGGITSHAAIVARELNIPCIIRVKDVTKILKTGQQIEVDADTGVIKII